MREKRVAWVLVLGAVVFLTLLPRFLSSSLLMVFFSGFLWLVLTANYDILGGFLGYIHLAQGTFFGVGAYTATLLLKLPAIQSTGSFAIPIVSLAAILLTGLFAAAISVPLFRLRGLYFAVATLVLVFLLRSLVMNLPSLTGGTYGAFIPRQYYQSTLVSYYYGLVLAIISVGINYYLSQSKTGLCFIAIREDEKVAGSLGLNATRQKTIAYVLSSLPSGAAGIIFALNSGFIDTLIALGIERSLLPPLMALLGGTGLVFGPVLGVIILRLMDVVLFHYVHLPVPSMVLFGIVLMLVALFIPGGLLKSHWVQKIAKGWAVKTKGKQKEI
jgi:branched-chain amino acid transport system permease protein